jgi:hypothetical protein
MGHGRKGLGGFSPRCFLSILADIRSSSRMTEQFIPGVVRAAPRSLTGCFTFADLSSLPTARVAGDETRKADRDRTG